ncbi:uncharacterized protein NPIL_302941 [Nephila pilipes]|uniref:Uncharacterized protein n=1 Tax=Nephila pilipes TaxID=299642 RepID=A0A8X6MSU9_NEPPI|nr:uncharacterized protein NPIL_302941 [Nephila pilipes]
MFENLQDTGLLHDSVLSALNRMNPSQEPELNWLSDLEDRFEVANIVSSETELETMKEELKSEKLSTMEAANIVASTVFVLTQKRMKETFSHEKVLEEQFYSHRRCHTTMFFNVLKSNGITCEKATAYYESVGSNFPPVDWKFYIMLCFQCEWSEYFVESALQLDSDILAIVVKNILNIDWNAEEHLKYYSLHMILQAIIWKFFIIEDPTLCSFPDSFSFSFPFVHADSKSQLENQELENNFSQNPLFQIFNVLLNQLFSFSISSLSNIDYIKIILHAYKTIFKLLRNIKTFKLNVVKELFLLNTLLKQCCFDSESQNIINSCKKEESIPLMHYYSNASWGVTESYLLFILCNYWNDTLKILSNKNETPFISLSENFPSNEEKRMLIKLCPFYADQFEENDFVISYLKSIINYNYPCASHAAVIILHHPNMREKDEILEILEKKASILKPLMINWDLIDVIAATESKEAKMRFKKLLHLMLSREFYANKRNIYNDTLKYMCLKYDMEDNFKLENFDNQLSVFTRKTMSLKEAEKCLLPLFVQSPKIVLETLIEQVLMQGSEGMDVIQILKLIPEACLYKDYLVTELEYYFSKEKLAIYEEKNMSILIESLMEIQAEEPLLDLNEFLQRCIIRNTLTNVNSLEFQFKCLIVAWKVLTNKNALIMSSDVYYSLIDKIRSFISTSIQFCNGKAKALAIATLPFLEKYQEHGFELTKDASKSRAEFDSCEFSSVDVYTSQLFGKKSYKDMFGDSDELCDSLWIWCCHFKDATLFQEILLKKIISYENLLDVLLTVLPHFTKEEWFESGHLIQEYFKHVDPATITCDMEWLLAKTDRQQYAAIRCLMDCYIYKPYQGHYFTACFTNTVTNLLIEAVPELYLNIFLDTCHIISITNANTLTLFLSFLVNIKKEIQKNLKDKNSKLFYNKMLYYGMKNLPDYQEKNSILQQFL